MKKIKGTKEMFKNSKKQLKQYNKRKNSRKKLFRNYFEGNIIQSHFYNWKLLKNMVTIEIQNNIVKLIEYLRCKLLLFIYFFICNRN